jgi:hypothetical protein
MSGLPESGHGWAIYEPAVGERAERPYKKRTPLVAGLK